MTVVSGTAAVEEDGSSTPGDATAQARRCFEIVFDALREVGAASRDVIRTRMYLVDPADADAVGAVHAELFGEIRPAATMVVIEALLRSEWLVEVEADALLAGSPVKVQIVEGDLLEQNVDAIVNAWNRNTFPWWLLLPQGVSGTIKRRGGTEPFRELRRHGRMALGEAVVTGAGRLPFKGIIHVAGIDDVWRSSEKATRLSVRNAVREAEKAGFSSLAIPLIGSGSWGMDERRTEAAILDELSSIESFLEIFVVRYVR